MKRPAALRVLESRQDLEITWDDGTISRLGAALLRENSPSAGSKRVRLMGLDVPAQPDLTITKVVPVGHYAVNLHFSDGHDRGIYPWSLLADLAG